MREKMSGVTGEIALASGRGPWQDAPMKVKSRFSFSAVSALPVVLLASLASTVPMRAQEAAPKAAAPEENTAPAEPTVDEVKEFLVRIDALIASREERATRLLNDMKANDKRIEDGIKSLTAMLASSTDSQQSKTRVARLKKEFIEGLGKAAEAYARKRAEVEEAMRNEPNAYTRADLFKARGAIDERINNRVQEIVDLATTFDEHKDLEKYRYLGTSGDWNSGWNEVWEDNPEYEQNRRAARQGNQVSKNIGKELDEANDRLSRRVAALRESLNSGKKLSDQERANLSEELERTEKILRTREEQRHKLISGRDPAPTKPISLQQAMALDTHIETAASDLRQDFVALFRTFSDWKTVRGQLGDCLARRDRAAKWLENKSAPQPTP